MGVTNRKNIIIVGAGASKEFGLPTGVELKDKITTLLNISFDDFGSRQLSGDRAIVQAIRDMGENVNAYLAEGLKICSNMAFAPSIDNFLDTHKENKAMVTIGKLAISRAIISEENKSYLNVYRNETGSIKDNLLEASEKWIGKFFRVLVSQRDFDSFKEALKNITFISFNYDRCLQQFFCYASKTYFDLEDADVQEVLDCLNIIYPYGNIGEYRWNGYGKTNFGSQRPVDLVTSIKSLRTFTEGCDEGVSHRITAALTKADIIMFLGFGYIPLNMEMLHMNNKFQVTRVIGTGFNLSDDTIKEILSDLRTTYKGPRDKWLDGDSIRVLNKTCADFIYEFERFLQK